MASGRGGGGMERFTSPVSYRVGLYDYSPAVKCPCNRKAPCWTSWSDDNPGQRYYRCPSGLKPGDCGYYVWIDRQTTQYNWILLCDLRDAIWRLRKEKAEEEEEQVQRVQKENGELRLMIVQLEKEKDELKNKMEVKEQLEIKENNYFSCFSSVTLHRLLCLLLHS
ncbi:hypothetical protein PVAP13_7KG052845 [Panicum virgatum]|uniref:GRF-type domain-containing protein n=1 Tax=Panicum virgatum TaxID=38727 RepID=A0A8T0QB21_PANVG|nr:hypothetical protein PVAP13_7KG052845 [Panicum virgatum]